MVDETTPQTDTSTDEGHPVEDGDLKVLVETDEVVRLRAQIEALERDKKDTYERLLRATADLDNFRKRQRREVDDARWKAREDALREILPGIDNLERALAVVGKEGGREGVVEGVRLVLRQFMTALERQEVKAFESVGQAFDPTRHEAISQVETEAHPPGAIAVELQRGYTIGGRLLRPALVAVAKAKPAAAPSTPDEGASEA